MYLDSVGKKLWSGNYIRKGVLWFIDNAFFPLYPHGSYFKALLGTERPLPSSLGPSAAIAHRLWKRLCVLVLSRHHPCRGEVIPWNCEVYLYLSDRVQDSNSSSIPFSK